MGLEFALLDASFETDEAPRNFSRSFDAEVVRYDVRDGDLPPPVSNGEFPHDGAVISGSAASVYWDRDWIDDVVGWVTDAADWRLPLLGVCFGHQVLADALGGSVRPMGERELGYHMIHRESSSRLFEDLDEWFVAFTAHSDEVVSLPDGARPLASNPFSLHAFARDRAFGVQLHPEMDRANARAIMRQRGTDGRHVERMLELVNDGVHNEAVDVKAIFPNFEAVAREARDADG
ncbi:MAG: type 1 glutamine amidotransferase [Haloarculaceae archaeon]